MDAGSPGAPEVDPFQLELPIELPDPPVAERRPIPLSWPVRRPRRPARRRGARGRAPAADPGRRPDPLAELSAHAFFYAYELVGSCLVFGIAGFVVGRRADRLRSGRDRYRDLSERDSLTGLVNARTFLARYRRAVEHATRFREPISLLVLDVDRLKAINDSLGHAFGSAALLHVARILSDCKRDDDMAARWGGDEFALLMPGADAVAARRQADAILEKLRREPLLRGATRRPMSVTIGVATGDGPPRRTSSSAPTRPSTRASAPGGRRTVGSP